MTAAPAYLPTRLAGLAALAARYRAAIVDLWGVVHNGVVAFPAATDALAHLRRRGCRVLLLSNAPRPNAVVRAQLDRLGVAPALYDAVLTSGDLTREWLENGALPGRGFHLGPERDHPLFEGLDVPLTADPDAADWVVCSGLWNDETERPEDYRPLLKRLAARKVPMICANPDRIARRGGATIPCAGSLALIYEGLGGPVTWHGKPYPAVYERALRLLGSTAGETLAIGDGIETDIPGANASGIDALLVTSGVHAELWGSPADPARLAEILSRRGLAVAGTLEHLAW